jgi:hypothetical protein
LYHRRTLPEANDMRNRVLTALIAALALSVFPIDAGPARRGGHPVPSRIVSVSQSGPNVQMKLDDGRSIEVPENAVRIVQRDEKSASGSSAQVSGRMSVSSLRSGSAPAVATVIYGKDGSVRRVRVQVFRSDDAANAFVSRAKSVQSKGSRQ